jgi:hypothetical protein
MRQPEYSGQFKRDLKVTVQSPYATRYAEKRPNLAIHSAGFRHPIRNDGGE